MSSVVQATTERRAGLAQVIILLAAACMPVMAATLITPVLPQMLQHFSDVDGYRVLVPMIVGLPALMVAVFAPFAGQIVDRVGRKTLIVVALVAYAFMGVIPAFVDGLTMILLSRLALGVSESAIITVATALIVDYFHEDHKRNRYLGLQGAAGAIGATVFIIVGTILGTQGWRAPFWIYLISLVIALPALWLLWEPRSVATGESVERGRIPWGRLWGPLIVTVFGGITFYALVVNLPEIVATVGQLDAASPAIGGLAALASAVVATGGIVFPAIKRRFDHRVVPLAFALQAVGLVLLWLLSPAGIPGVDVGALIASFGSGLLLPGFLTWVVVRAGFAERGRVTGLWTAAFFLGNFLVAPVVNGIGANIGIVTAMGVFGIIAAPIAAITWVASRPGR